jgi:hypothetical protein
MSKNGNKIAVVGGASRVGCAAMTVTAAAILAASHCSPTRANGPRHNTALESVFGSSGLRRTRQGHVRHGSFVGLPGNVYSLSLFSATIPVVARFSLGGGDPDAPTLARDRAAWASSSGSPTAANST